MGVDLIISIATSLLGVLSLIEVFILRRIYSKLLRGYIFVMALFFFSVALAHIHPVFEYVLWGTSITAAAFKIFLASMMKGKLGKEWRSSYMADIYKTTGMLHGVVNDIFKDDKK